MHHARLVVVQVSHTTMCRALENPNSSSVVNAGLDRGEDSVASACLKIRNLPMDTSEARVLDACAAFGACVLDIVLCVRSIESRHSVNRSFCIIRLRSVPEAVHVMRCLQGRTPNFFRFLSANHLVLGARGSVQVPYVDLDGGGLLHPLLRADGAGTDPESGSEEDFEGAGVAPPRVRRVLLTHLPCEAGPELVEQWFSRCGIKDVEAVVGNQFTGEELAGSSGGLAGCVYLTLPQSTDQGDAVLRDLLAMDGQSCSLPSASVPFSVLPDCCGHDKLDLGTVEVDLGCVPASEDMPKLRSFLATKCGEAPKRLSRISHTAFRLTFASREAAARLMQLDGLSCLRLGASWAPDQAVMRMGRCYGPNPVLERALDARFQSWQHLHIPRACLMLLLARRPPGLASAVVGCLVRLPKASHPARQNSSTQPTAGFDKLGANPGSGSTTQGHELWQILDCVDRSTNGRSYAIRCNGATCTVSMYLKLGLGQEVIAEAPVTVSTDFPKPSREEFRRWLVETMVSDAEMAPGVNSDSERAEKARALAAILARKPRTGPGAGDVRTSKVRKTPGTGRGASIRGAAVPARGRKGKKVDVRDLEVVAVGQRKRDRRTIEQVMRDVQAAKKQKSAAPSKQSWSPAPAGDSTFLGIGSAGGGGSSFATDVPVGAGSSFADDVPVGAGSSFAEDVPVSAGSSFAEDVPVGAGSSFAETALGHGANGPMASRGFFQDKSAPPTVFTSASPSKGAHHYQEQEASGGGFYAN